MASTFQVLLAAVNGIGRIFAYHKAIKKSQTSLKVKSGSYLVFSRNSYPFTAALTCATFGPRKAINSGGLLKHSNRRIIIVNTKKSRLPVKASGILLRYKGLQCLLLFHIVQNSGSPLESTLQKNVYEEMGGAA